MWTYWWYEDPNDPTPWQTWYSRQSNAVRGKHDSVFKFLENSPLWREPFAKQLSNGVIEVRITGETQHRLLGFYWPREQFHFTFVLTCTHKGRVYDPKEALRTATERIRDIRNGTRRIIRHARPKRA